MGLTNVEVVLSTYMCIVDWYRQQNPIFDKFGIKAADHMRLDVDGVIEEVTRAGWTYVDTRKFLDYQYFAVFTPR